MAGPDRRDRALPSGTQARGGIRSRRCRYPAAEEIADRAGLAVTTPARTLVDLAGMFGDSSLERMVEQAAVLRLLDLDLLDAAIGRAKGRRGIAALRAILGGWSEDDGATPDVRSVFEARVLRLLVGRGLPRPVCNETVHLGEESIVVDFLWREERLIVETDGRRTHATPVAFQRDRRRDQALVGAGYRVTRVTWAQIQQDPGAVMAGIGRALRAAR